MEANRLVPSVAVTSMSLTSRLLSAACIKHTVFSLIFANGHPQVPEALLGAMAAGGDSVPFPLNSVALARRAARPVCPVSLNASAWAHFSPGTEALHEALTVPSSARGTVPSHRVPGRTPETRVGLWCGDARRRPLRSQRSISVHPPWKKSNLAFTGLETGPGADILHQQRPARPSLCRHPPGCLACSEAALAGVFTACGAPRLPAAGCRLLSAALGENSRERGECVLLGKGC